jgi:hypothetical protein
VGIDVYYCVDCNFGDFDCHHEEVMFGIVAGFGKAYRFRVRDSRS